MRLRIKTRFRQLIEGMPIHEEAINLLLPSSHQRAAAMLERELADGQTEFTPFQLLVLDDVLQGLKGSDVFGDDAREALSGR